MDNLFVFLLYNFSCHDRIEGRDIILVPFCHKIHQYDEYFWFQIILSFTLVLYSIISLHLPTLISPLKSLYNIQQYQIFLRILIKFHSTLNQILQRDEQIQQWLNVIFFSHLK